MLHGVHVRLLAVSLVVAGQVAFLEDREVDGLDTPVVDVTTALAGTEVTLSFAGGQMGGSACNRYGGDYTLEGGVLAPGDIASTKMACQEPDGVMRQEQRCLGELMRASRYAVVGRQLRLETEPGPALIFASEE